MTAASRLDERQQMILGILHNKVSPELAKWAEHQFFHGAAVEDLERSLHLAAHQIERVNAYCELPAGKQAA